MGPFGCLIGIIVAAFGFLLIIALQLLMGVKRFFNSFKGNKGTGNRTTHNTQQNNTHQNTSPTHQKIFDDNEGEYVDFEEIK